MSNIIKINSQTGHLNLKVKTSVDLNTENDKDEFQVQLEERYRSGYEEGYKKAHSELENKYNEFLIDKSNYFQSILENVNNALTEFEESFQHIVIKVSAVIAEKIIKRKIEEETIINDVLFDCLKKISGANSIVVNINPKDIEWLKNIPGSFLQKETLSRIKFEGDENIEPGGCIIESEIGNIDSRISTQINEIKRQLENSIVEEVQ